MPRREAEAVDPGVLARSDGARLRLADLDGAPMTPANCQAPLVGSRVRVPWSPVAVIDLYVAAAVAVTLLVLGGGR